MNSKERAWTVCMSLTGIDGMVQQVVQGIILIVVVTLSFDRKNAAVIK